MDLWEGALWGIAGGITVEFYDYQAVVRATRTVPWHDPEVPKRRVDASARRRNFGIWLSATLFRVAAGGVQAAAFSASGQVAGAIAAFGLGVAGPLVVERLLATTQNAAPGEQITLGVGKSAEVVEEARSGPRGRRR
ncbi:hypothetical protein [Actinosynnema sp. NPDC020468]|uniref:hypothetical protein n=1 Tax=Actinosynnema sp. NPDC020468 TaxID=3154488 RepID=UPI0033E1A482